MKPVKQKVLKHDPENGLWGDCHRACLASILECELEEVPHTADQGVSGEEMHRQCREFLKTKGFGWACFGFAGEKDDHWKTVLNFMKVVNPGIYYILGAQSESGVGHSVVCLNDKIVHNPNGSKIVGGLPNDNDPSTTMIWVELITGGPCLVREE